MWNNEYVKCPTSCSDDTPFTECACSCPTLDFEDLGFMDIMTILEDVGIDIYLRPSGAQGGPTAMQDSVVEEVSIAEMARQAAVSPLCPRGPWHVLGLCSRCVAVQGSDSETSDDEISSGDEDEPADGSFANPVSDSAKGEADEET